MAEKIISQIEARQSVNQRTIETRKKILLGALVGELLRTGKIEQETIEQGLDSYLVRKQDRELFGLSEKPKPKITLESSTRCLKIN